MSTLTKIQKLAASVKNSLAALKPVSLDDLEQVAQERAVLREKLNLLDEAERDERLELDAADKDTKLKQRRAYLTTVVSKAEKAGQEHHTLTNRATELVSELVHVLVQRESVFNRESTGIYDSGFDLLSHAEKDQILRAFDRSLTGLPVHAFHTLWGEAVSKHCPPDNVRIKTALHALAQRGNDFKGKLRSVGSCLAEEAKTLASIIPQATPAPVVKKMEAAPTGHRYEADLRNSGNVVNLNAK